MDSICPGDVYFLKSPIKSSDPETEKKLSYLMGTVSARPVVVLRSPQWWDDFSMVLVIPALTKAKIADTIHLTDRHGYESASTFPFVPHMPYSVPVQRLGRYIGHLSQVELERIWNEFCFINSPFRSTETKQIPAMYSGVIGKKPPKATGRSPYYMPTVVMDEKVMTIETKVGKKMVEESFEIEIEDNSHAIPEELVDGSNDFNEVAAGTAEAAEAEVSSDENVVVTSGRFPPSIFKEEDLLVVANRFEIDENFWSSDGIKKRSVDAIRLDEMDIMRNGISDVRFNILMDIYDSFTPVDALLFCPFLPTYKLCGLLHLSVSDCTVLKKICTFLKDLDEEEYLARLSSQQEEPAMEDPKEEEPINLSCNIKLYDPKKAKAAISSMREYLCNAKIEQLPERFYKDFIRIPQNMIKKAYVGKGFQVKYTTVYAKAKAAEKEG